ncbi:hypothetical protein ID866_674 [Astraeus odoratus]|nr:hypothetical protein ID866_674 [Astraeus odoratus]
MDLLVLSHGDVHVYATDLEKLARSEFNLGNADLEFYSSCINMCNGVPARVGPRVWDSVPEAPAPTPPPEQPYRMVVDDSEGYASTSMLDAHDTKPSVNVMSGKDAEHPNLSAPENSEEEGEDKARNARRGRRDGSEDALQTTDEEWKAVPRGRTLRDSARAEPALSEDEEYMMRTPKRVQHTRTTRPSSGDAGKQELGTRPKKPRLKSSSRSPGRTGYGNPEEQEPLSAPPAGTQKLPDVVKSQGKVQQPSQPRDEETLPEPAPTSQQSESQTESQRMLIRVAHRSSKQESKFTVKGSTKVSKVITSVCKSFLLDPSHAKLFLIVDTDDEEGIMENLFPCDKNDTMARAGAEASGESKYVLQLPGDARP